LADKLSAEDLPFEPIGQKKATSVLGYSIDCELSKRIGNSVSNQKTLASSEVAHPTDYLIIDEISQVGCHQFAEQSRNLSAAKATAGTSQDNLPFGGLNVVIFGDFNQIRLIGARSLHLHKEKRKLDQTPDAILGRQLYTEFKHAVRLTQQFRCTDMVWQDTLQAVRGSVPFENKHVDLLRSLILPVTPAKRQAFFEAAIFDQADWHKASLISPRRLDRDQWNSKAVQAFAARHRLPVYVCQACDTYDSSPLTALQKAEVLAAKPEKRGVREAGTYRSR
jgi:hypothetical protein